jgi:hypothetical protein
MNSPELRTILCGCFLVVIPVLALSGCGDDGSGPEGEKTGATLQGQIIQVGAAVSLSSGAPTGDGIGATPKANAEPTSDVTVSIGSKSTKTDGSGSFVLIDIPIGNQVVEFSGSGVTAAYSLNDVSLGDSFTLYGIQLTSGTVETEHTGTWIGTAGSTDPGSQGQIEFTLIISANGNALTGTGTVPAPDNSQWAMSGIETGTKVEGLMALVSSDSECATGATFTGTFSADTLSGTFVEVNPPAGCGSPENGTFRVVKQ